MSDPTGVLMMAYGGPDSLGEVEPYLFDVRGGRPTPAQVVDEVKRRYEQIGGRSPILERTQAQAEALQVALDEIGGDFRVSVGMRHWHPYIAETVAEMDAAGIHKLVGLVMAPHYSRMSIGAYYARLDEAIERLGQRMEVAAIESWKDDPGYLDAVQDRIRDGLARFPSAGRDDVHLIFTAHSLPERILGAGDPYPEELQLTFDLLRERFPSHPTYFAYQSAAMTQEPWLGPDAGDLMLELIEKGAERFLVVPIGFVSEHVEILYDIDIEFRTQVEAAGGRIERIEMPGAHPRMMSSLAARVRAAAQARGWL